MKGIEYIGCNWIERDRIDPIRIVDDKNQYSGLTLDLRGRLSPINFLLFVVAPSQCR